jgi:hypothetical protein
VAITDSLGLLPVNSQVTVVPIAMGIDCKAAPRSREDVEREYPTGASITVVGPIETDAMPTILSWADDFGSVALTPGNTSFTASGCLDFLEFGSSYEDDSSSGFSIETAWSIFHRSAYEDYEFFRCLELLEAIAEFDVSVEGYSNLSHYSGLDRGSIELSTDLFRTLLKSSNLPRRDRKRLMREFRARLAG